MAELLQICRTVRDGYDVIIVGGGPAGLSAALVLGRCRRRVLVCDAGEPRNRAARALHGYLTRDGIPPLDLLRLGRSELSRYGVLQRKVTVTDATCRGDSFSVTLDTGEELLARTLLLATGVRDRLPDIQGIEECYGISVHHCPYCDGWEVRERALIVLGRGAPAAGLAMSLTTWSDRVAICSNGQARLDAARRRELASRDIAIDERPIARLEHDNGLVRRLVFNDGPARRCDAIFFTSRQRMQSDLALRFGCDITSKGVVKTDHLGHTRVPGLYVVGDASRDVQFVVVAAAEGAKAGVAINRALQERGVPAARRGGFVRAS